MTTYPQDILAEGLNTLDLQGRGLGAQKSEEVTKLQKLHFNNSLNEETKQISKYLVPSSQTNIAAFKARVNYSVIKLFLYCCCHSLPTQ